MLKLSACIEMIFRELPFNERIRRVAESGLPAFEFWAHGNKNISEIAQAKAQTGLEVAALVGGSNIVKPGSEAAFVAQIKESIQVAKKLDCPSLIVTTGQELPDLSRDEQHASIVSCLKAAAPLVEEAGITIVLEPLNVLVDHKGYYLYSSQEGFEILRELGSPNVKLLYDIYHQQITEGNLIATISDNIDLIGHFHVADVPGRHEPGTGEINYKNVFTAIERTGYNGYVGLEFRPVADPAAALAAVKDMAP